MKSRYLKLLFFIFLCSILSFSFIFSSCKEEKAADTTQTKTSGEETSTEKEQNNPALDRMIGEMIILGFMGTEVDSSSGIIQDINKYNIGGVILFDYDVPSKSFPRNILDPYQTKKLIEDLKKFTHNDLLIAIDAEGGYVNRLKAEYGFEQIASAQVMGESDPGDTFFGSIKTWDGTKLSGI